MTAKRNKFAPAVTLIEVMVAMAVLAVAAVGALGYQYYAAAQGRIAHAETTATGIAQLLLEDWKSTGGSGNYNASALGLGIYSELKVSHGEAVHLPEGAYSITTNNVPILILLNYEDVGYDSEAEVTLRQLSVSAMWQRSSDADLNWGDIVTQEVAYGRTDRNILRPLVTLTTYVRVDASGG